MKILVISPKNKTLFNFRGDLIKTFIAQGHEVLATGPNNDHLEEVLDLGVTFVKIPFSKDKINIFSDLKYYLALKRLIKKEKPDLVFSYTIKPVIYGSLAAQNSGAKKIYPMITGLGRLFTATDFKYKVLRKIISRQYKKSLMGSTKVIFQNSDDLDTLVNKMGLPRDKTVMVNGSGVNLRKFYTMALPTHNTFIMVARIIKEKGIFEYAKAAKLVKQQYPEAQFLLVGGYDKSFSDSEKQELHKYVNNGTIKFIGETDNVQKYIEQARYFVLPTYYREGLPRTILEAMAMGRPIITTDWPGCRDAVYNGVNGYLVKPKDSENLAEAMLKMIQNPNNVEHMVEENNKRVKSIYDVNIVNQEMMKIMEIDFLNNKISEDTNATY